MTVYFVIILLITAIYVVIISSFIYGWKNIEEYKPQQFVNSKIHISVIVAVKNEAENITTLLNSLKNQFYSKNNFDIILVNDHSTDNTLAVAQTYMHTMPNLHIITLEKHKAGKKAAIDYGVNIAKGKLIVSTDADCTHHANWLSTIASYYEEYRPKLIVAPVLMSCTNSFESMQSLDFFSLMASGAAAVGISQAIMCNGANLAFEKNSYQEIKDPLNSKYSSGDDIFLLLNLKKNNRKEIHFLKSKKAVVMTNAEPNFRQFIKQRTRWASKSKGYTDYFIILVAFAVLLINFSIFINLSLSFIFKELFFVFSLQLLAKSLVDYLFLFITSTFFQKNNVSLYFIPVQILNLFFIPFFAFKGLFTRSFHSYLADNKSISN